MGSKASLVSRRIILYVPCYLVGNKLLLRVDVLWFVIR